MGYKTDRLVQLIPDAYAVADRESLLFKLLDAVGAELLLADEALKTLLKSHWVRYAEGPALDALGAIYGVSRRQLRGENRYEADEPFRLRLRSVVRQYTGGGTRDAVVGAVRSALGLPFSLDDLGLPAEYAGLRDELAGLIRLVEFSPRAARLASSAVSSVEGASQITLNVDADTVQAVRPRVLWRFTRGGGRRLRLEVGGQGLQADPELIVPAGATLSLSASDDGLVTALLGNDVVTARFSNLDGSRPPRLPAVPAGRSAWAFRAVGGIYGVSVFDRADSFDLPEFAVELIWTSLQPLTFDLFVPYHFEQAVESLRRRRGYPGRLLAFSGLPPERIQEVVDQTRAAGVRGSVHFTLNFFEDQPMADRLRLGGEHRARERHEQAVGLVLGSFSRAEERHEQRDGLVIGAPFDHATFDGHYAFV